MENNIVQPVVVRDARFKAGRTLIERGHSEEAIQVFETLLKEVISSFDTSSIETVPAYYEYGNSILRSTSGRMQQQPHQEQQKSELPSTSSVTATKNNDFVDTGIERTASIDKKPGMSGGALSATDSTLNGREAAAAAAEQRAKLQRKQQQEEIHLELANKSQQDDEEKQAYNFESTSNCNATAERVSSGGEKRKAREHDVIERGGEHLTNPTNDNDDLQLALEMMETAWSLLDEYLRGITSGSMNASDSSYEKWAVQQSPRILTGIGDVLSALGRHADAADAYSRALKLRQEALPQFISSLATYTVSHLQSRRHVVEASVLVAEELLLCPNNQDVITSESCTMLVKAADRIDFARGYYDKARDELQETVLLMGEMAARGIDIGSEKDDVCMAATLVMGVGETLAEIDERMSNKKHKS